MGQTFICSSEHHKLPASSQPHIQEETGNFVPDGEAVVARIWPLTSI
jgi:hypothetical protein